MQPPHYGTQDHWGPRDGGHRVSTDARNVTRQRALLSSVHSSLLQHDVRRAYGFRDGPVRWVVLPRSTPAMQEPTLR